MDLMNAPHLLPVQLEGKSYFLGLGPILLHLHCSSQEVVCHQAIGGAANDTETVVIC